MIRRRVVGGEVTERRHGRSDADGRAVPPRGTFARAGSTSRLALAALVAAVSLSACKRCGGETTSADAGSSSSSTSANANADAGAITGIDLRSAMILMFPEFRGAAVHGARAWVERTLKSDKPLGPLDALLSAPAKQKGFGDVTVEENGTLHAKKPPFELTARRIADDTLMQSMSVRLAPEDVQHLYTAPSSLGSEQLQFMLPKVEGAKTVSDVLRIELAYDAKPERANFLVRQLVEGSIGVGWVPDEPLNWPGRKEDGGVGDIPLRTTVTIRRADSGGAMAVTRNGGEVYILYTQPLTISGR